MQNVEDCEENSGKKWTLTGAKSGCSVVTTHEGHTGASDSIPKEKQLPHPLDLHVFFHKLWLFFTNPDQWRFTFQISHRCLVIDHPKV